MSVFKKIQRGKISSLLSINAKYYEDFNEDMKFYQQLMPLTSLHNKALTKLIVGYRFYLISVLIDKQGEIRKPQGDPIISTFPYILDSPDILEPFIEIFNEDFTSKMKSTRTAKDVKRLKEGAVNYISRVLNVINFDKFRFLKSTMLQSSNSNNLIRELRSNLMSIGLKSGVPGLGFKPKEPIENITTFKPFSINEL